MNCRSVRDLLTSTRAARLDEHAESHLERCAACARYRDTLSETRRALREHHANVTPDSGFAARVTRRLERAPSDMLGQAALQLLPAGLLLVMALTWWAVSTEPASPIQTESESPTDDLLAWVLETGEAEESEP